MNTTLWEQSISIRRIVVFTVVMMLFAGAITACAAEPTPQAPVDAVPISTMDRYTSRYHPAHISSEEAWELFNSSECSVIIDVRSNESFQESRVSVAVNVAYEELADYAAANIPDKDSIIITYCFCDDKGGPALSARNLLTELGYTNAFYTEPEDEWTFVGTNISNASASSSGSLIVSGEEAKELFISYDSAVLLDVRSLLEYSAGHIDGSINIPVNQLDARLSELPNKDSVIIVYCRTGRRSASAFEILIANSYTNVYNMERIDNWPG